MASENTEGVVAVAKTTSRIVELVKWFFNPIRTIKQAEADAHAFELSRVLSEKYPEYDVSYNDGKLNFSKYTQEELIARAKNRILADALRRQSNCERVLMLATNEVQQSESASNEPLDEDWLIRFFGVVGDVSSEDMQLIWSKILAGEIIQPGRFSLRTIDTIRNVSKSEAEIFQKAVPLVMKLADSASCCFIVADRDILKKYGVSYEMVLRLRECGLLNASDLSSVETPILNQREHLIACNDNKLIIAWGINNIKTQLSCGVHILTRAGSELYSILEHGCNDGYVTDFAHKIYEENKSHIQRITIHDAISDGKYSDQISQSFPA